MNKNKIAREVKSILSDIFVPKIVEGDSATVEMAKTLTDRAALTDYLTYQGFDNENNLLSTFEGDRIYLCYTMEFYPFLVAGTTVEPQLVELINSAPPNSIIQFAVLSSPYVDNRLQVWAQAKTANTSDIKLKQMSTKRADFVSAISGAVSGLKSTRFHSRELRYFISVKIPYADDISDYREFNRFKKTVTETREKMRGILSQLGLPTANLNQEQMTSLMRELLNPQMEPNERIGRQMKNVPLKEQLIEKSTRIRMTDNGIEFSDNGGIELDRNNRRVTVVPITADQFPEHHWLPSNAALIGDANSGNKHIVPPFWAYTNIHVLDPDDAKNALTNKLGLLNKQVMSESDWLRSMMPHLFARRDDAQMLLSSLKGGSQIVRTYMGINLVCHPDEARKYSQETISLWRGQGFKASEETAISLPIFLCSLPFHFSEYHDSLGGSFKAPGGLQRASTMSSLNAATLSHVQGDWKGHAPQQGGMLFMSRRGQVVNIDLFDSQTNYNFVVTATSGAGKSVLANDLVSDILCRDGIMRIIDQGRSYYRFCEDMGGQNVVFNPEEPKSMNPFWGYETKEKLFHVMTPLRDLIRYMAWPTQTDQDIPQWEYQLIPEAIGGAWDKYKEKLELRHVAEWLMNYDDDEEDHSIRAKKIAQQIGAYATGRYARWFEGAREVEFNNRFVVIELDELKSDPELKAIVLSLCVNQITRDMYLQGAEKPKCLLVDEAWDLLSNDMTAYVIEQAFRIARKYYGAAGIITQSFSDYYKYPAAKAALDNANWRFTLKQSQPSLKFAVDEGLFDNEVLQELARSVTTLKGEYSEVLIQSGSGGTGLYRLLLDRHSYYYYTSDSRDKQKIKDLTEQGMSIEEAVDQLATDDYRNMWKLDEHTKQ